MWSSNAIYCSKSILPVCDFGPGFKTLSIVFHKQSGAIVRFPNFFFLRKCRWYVHPPYYRSVLYPSMNKEGVKLRKTDFTSFFFFAVIIWSNWVSRPLYEWNGGGRGCNRILRNRIRLKPIFHKNCLIIHFGLCCEVLISNLKNCFLLCCNMFHIFV